MNVGEFRPRDRSHFGRRVQLHRARTQRNHGVNQGQIFLFQSRDISHHFVLGVIDVEHRVRQVLGLSGKLRFFNVHGRCQGRRGEIRRLAAV